MDISLDTAKAIYRRAIDEKASDGEGSDWWAAVAAQVIAVVQAESVAAAAKVIEWWHHDWDDVECNGRMFCGGRCRGRYARILRIENQIEAIAA